MDHASCAVWLWDEWPGRWGRDRGIDLIFEHRKGQTWAVQAKCYAPEYEVTKADVRRIGIRVDFYIVSM